MMIVQLLEKSTSRKFSTAFNNTHVISYGILVWIWSIDFIELVISITTNFSCFQI